MARRDYRQPGLHDDPRAEALAEREARIAAYDAEIDQNVATIERLHTRNDDLRALRDKEREELAAAYEAYDSGEDSPLLRPTGNRFVRDEIKDKRKKHRGEPNGDVVQELEGRITPIRWTINSVKRKDRYYEAVIRRPLDDDEMFDPDAARDEATAEWETICEGREATFRWVNQPHAHHHEANTTRPREGRWLSRGLVRHPAHGRYGMCRAPPRRSSLGLSRSLATQVSSMKFRPPFHLYR